MTSKENLDSKESFPFGRSVILYLVLAAVSILFLTLMVAYMYTSFSADLPPIQVPILFYVSTPIILLVSYFGSKTLNYYDQNKFGLLVRNWWLILALLVIFMILQYLGWHQLINDGYPAGKDNSMGFLFVLSIAHFVHIIFGLPFHIRQNWVQYKFSKGYELDPLSYLANETNRLNLKMILRYWHFLDILWVILMLFFVLNSL